MTAHRAPAASPRASGTALVATVAGVAVSIAIMLAPIVGIVSAELRDDPVGLSPTPSPGPAPIPAP